MMGVAAGTINCCPGFVEGAMASDGGHCGFGVTKIGVFEDKIVRIVKRICHAHSNQLWPVFLSLSGLKQVFS